MTSIDDKKKKEEQLRVARETKTISIDKISQSLLSCMCEFIFRLNAKSYGFDFDAHHEKERIKLKGV